MNEATYVFILSHEGAGLLASRGTTVIAHDLKTAENAYAEAMRVPVNTVRVLAATDRSQPGMPEKRPENWS